MITFRIDNRLSRGELTVNSGSKVPLVVTLHDAYERLTRELTLALDRLGKMLTLVLKSDLQAVVGT